MTPTMLNEGRAVSRGSVGRGSDPAYRMPIDGAKARELMDGLDAATPLVEKASLDALEGYLDSQRRDKGRSLRSMYTDTAGWWKGEGDDKVDDEVKYEIANRRYIAHAFGQTTDEQAKMYPSYRDRFFEQTFGKVPTTESEAFTMLQKSAAAQDRTEQALRELPSTLALNLMRPAATGTDAPELASLDLFNAWKERHADILQDLPEDWESRAMEQAEEIRQGMTALMREIGPDAKKAWDILQKWTRPESTYTGDPEERTGKRRGASSRRPKDAQVEDDSPVSRQDIEDLAKSLTNMPEDRQERLFNALFLAAEATGAGMGKGFFEKVGEGLVRGGVRIFDDSTMANQDRTARLNLERLRSSKPVYETLNGIVRYDDEAMRLGAAEQGAPLQTGLPAGSEPMSDDRRRELLEANEQRLREMQTLRKVRQLAEGAIDPLKTELDGLGGRFIQGAYTFSQSAAYTAMAAVPMVGFPAVAYSLSNSNYLRMLDEYPDMDTDFAWTLSMAIGAPQAVVERFKANALLGKSPALNALMKRMTDARTPLAARIAAGYGANVAYQTGQEFIQEAMPTMADQIAAAIREDMPEFDAKEAWGQYLNEMPEIFFSMLWAGLIGGSVVTLREFKRDGIFLTNVGELEMVGVVGETARDIAAEPDVDVRNEKLKTALNNRKPEDIKAGIAKRAAMMQAAGQQQGRELPTRHTATDAEGNLTHIIYDQQGNELLRTSDTLAADVAYIGMVRQIMGAELNSNIDTTRELIRQWKEGDSNRTVNTPDNNLTAAEKLKQLEATQNVEQIAVLHRTIKDKGLSDVPYDQIYILGEASVEQIGEMIFRSTIAVFPNGLPETAREEMHHVGVKIALESGTVTLDTLREWLAQTEDVLGQKFARDTADQIVESLAVVQRAFEDGLINADQETGLPPSFVDYIKRMIAAFAEVMRRALALRNAFDTGALPAEYEAFLAKTTGVNQQAIVDAARERTVKEVAPEVANYSIGIAAQLSVENSKIAKEIQRKADAVVAADQEAEDVFFTKFWPKMLKKAGLNLKPTKANLTKAAEYTMPELLEWLKDNPQYLDYYHKDWDLTKTLLQAVYPNMTDDQFIAFRLFTGITSPNTKLRSNMADAVQLFDLWMREGSIKSMEWEWSAKGNRKVKTGPFMFSGTTGAGKTYAAHVLEDIFQELGSWQAVLAHLYEAVAVKEINAYRNQRGWATGIEVGKVKEVVKTATGQSDLIPRMFIFGPKVGAYTLNTSGDDRFTTTDIWEGRFIRSHFPSMFQAADGLPISVEENRIFQEFSQAFNEVFQKMTGLNLPPSALQAVRWFFMLNHAKKAGYRYASTNDTISGYAAQAIRGKLGFDLGVAGEGGRGSGQAGDRAGSQTGAVDNYSISTQPEIDRVKAGLDKITRGPDARTEIYERAKVRLAEVLEANWNTLRGMEGVAQPNEIRRTQILQTFGVLDAVLQELPPEVRGKIGLTNLTEIAPVDVFKDGTKVSEANSARGGITGAWMREGMNIGQARKETSLPEGYSIRENLDSARADKAIVAALRTKFDAIDRALERTLRDDYRFKIDKLIESAKPKKDERRILKGRLTPETAALVEEADRLRSLNTGQTTDKMQSIYAQLDAAKDPDKIEALVEELTLLQLFGDFQKLDSVTLADSFAWLSALIQQGRDIRKVLDEERSARMQELRGIAVEEFSGGKGILDQPAEVSRSDRRRSQKVRQAAYTFHLKNQSFEWLLNAATRPDKRVGTLQGRMTQLFSKMVHAATHQERRRKTARERAAHEELARIFGVKTGLALANKQYQWRTKISYDSGVIVQTTEEVEVPVEVAQRAVDGVAALDFTKRELGILQELLDDNAALPPRNRKGNVKLQRAKGPKVEMALTQDTALYYYMLSKQDGPRESLEYYGWDEASFAALEAFLSPETKAIYAWLSKEYYDGYDYINSVYRQIHNVNMPRVDNYSPVNYIVDAKLEENLMDNDHMMSSSSPSFVRSRVRHRAQVNERGALDMYFRHLIDSEHYVAWALPMRDMRGVLGHKDVQRVISQQQGATLVNLISDKLDQFAAGGRKAADAIPMLDAIRSSFVIAKQSFNWGVMIKQLTSFPAYLYDIPFKDFFKYEAEFWANPVAATKKIASLPFTAQRFGEGFDRDMLRVTKQFEGLDTPRTRLARAAEWGMIAVKFGDIVPVVVGGYAAYRYKYDQVMAQTGDAQQAEAEAVLYFEMVTERAQQAGDVKDQSFYQSGGSIARMLSMFKTAPRQYYSNVYESMLDWRAGKKGAGEEFARRLFIGQVILPIFFQMAGDLVRNAFREPDERELDPMDYLRAIAVGPFNGLFFFGSILEAASYWFIKGRWFDNNQLTGMSEMDRVYRSFGRVGTMIKDGQIDAAQTMKTLDDLAIATSSMAGGGYTWYDIGRRLIRSVGLDDEMEELTGDFLDWAEDKVTE